MGDVWIRDTHGRVLGPIRFEVLEELIRAGKVRDLAEASTDGKAWQPVARIPRIASLLAAQTSEGRRPADLAQAAALRAELQALKGRPPQKVFGLPEDAPLESFRAAFFALVKKCYPGNLPPEAAPELRQASHELFAYLSRLMTYIERLPPLPAKEPAPVPVVGPAVPPSYDLEDFIGVEVLPERTLRASLKVTEATWPMFSREPPASLPEGGAFVPYDFAVPLGTAVELSLHFDDPPKDIAAAGVVSSWSQVPWSAGSRRICRGLVVQMGALDRADRTFLHAYSRRMARKAR